MRHGLSTVGAGFIAPSGAINGAPTVCLAALLLAGCTTAPEAVRIAVPVPCRVALPARPAMPTENLTPDASLDDFVAAAAAEIERREGYELQLRAALEVCATTTSVTTVGAQFIAPATFPATQGRDESRPYTSTFLKE